MSLIKKVILVISLIFPGFFVLAQEGHCNEDVFTAFAYRSNSNACFEFTYKGCRDLLEETVYDTKKSCEVENVVEVEDVWDGKIICTRDLKRCDDGSYVSRVGSACEFAKCPFYAEPETCNNDKKRCEDGSFVKRSGPFCNFEECGSNPVNEDEKRCDVIWTGYKYDQDKKTCVETNAKGCENPLYESVSLCEDENETEDQELNDNFTNCSLEYMPVCAELDGVEGTYTNKCLMKLEGATFVGDGTCGQVNSFYAKVINWISDFFSNLTK